MESIGSFVRQIESLNTELLNKIKAEISKVDWQTENTKSLIFSEPLPYLEPGDESIIFIHEISNLYTKENSLSYHYSIEGNSKRMHRDEIWINPGEGLELLYKIAKHLESTDIYGGHIVRTDSPSEKLGLMWTCREEKTEEDYINFLRGE